MFEVCECIIQKTILMKTITLFSLLMFIFFSKIYSQDKEPLSRITVNEIGITVSNSIELSTLNWDDLFSVFEQNQPTDSISMYIQLKDFEIGVGSRSNLVYNNLKVSVKGIVENKRNLKEKLMLTTEKLVANLKVVTEEE